MCYRHTHLASQTGPSLPAAPEFNIEALEEAAKKNPTLKSKILELAKRLTFIVM